ncbi:NADH-quinone oxidoreductase subunit NuoE [Rhodopseudomonas boonkerdii]|uniref:NADH-quinone oxidoreductase subunit NuoE n=1 Tax=Rhodopseudomonas boonkerdii TaxID=475937 RepID=UPI001E3E7C00|nr:NADH-quinone oxidoreductase subunit NuoE [Rhodopseudomonas boonkerdii]UGV26478.1 NADH-quinone oxidoreductase subunit NuoE [Rhodopseudomonas boonkerdii]
MSVRRLAPKEQQPASFAFTPENLAWAKKQIEKFPPGRQASAVISILWRAQEQHAGWVSEAAIRYVADMLEMPYIRVMEVATFYTMFQLQPVGKKAHIQVCGTTPCMLRGAGDLIDVCKHRIHHDPFHLSEDGDFSWEEVECLGACVNAPMVMIWSDTYEDLTKDSMNKLIDGFASGNPPKPGPQIDRQHAAPEGGARVLKDTSANYTKQFDAPPKEPALADAEPKKAGEAANVQERPAPKPPAADATKDNPPKDKTPKEPKK